MIQDIDHIVFDKTMPRAAPRPGQSKINWRPSVPERSHRLFDEIARISLRSEATPVSVYGLFNA